jgi:carboxyl-terminal processing protease
MKKWLYLLFLILASPVAAQPCADPLCKKTFLLNRFLWQQHYEPIRWNDSMAAFFFNRWIERLDENKMLFTREDLTRLSRWKNRLVGEIQGGGRSFFDESLQLYRRRWLQSDSLLRIYLSKPVDFSKPDQLQWPPTDFSSNTDWARRWQQRVKYRILDAVDDLLADSTGTKFLEVPANFAALEKTAREKLLRQQVQRMKARPMDASFEEKMTENYLNTIASCYDPHTNYMSMADKKEFETALSGFEFSTGLDVGRNERGDWEVNRLTPGGTAWRSGALHVGDILVKIQTGTAPAREIADMSASEVQAFLHGNSDEAVTLTVRQKTGVQKTVTLIKEKIEADEEVVKGYLLSKGTAKIGYIVLPGFYTQADAETENLEGCANDVAKEVLKLKREGIEGLILDLRDNGGGSMGEAVQLAGIFINEGVMGAYKVRGDPGRFMKDPNRGTIYDGRLLVMVNGGSASASEFLSAVLQDYNRALIVGGNTYGKGTAQVILPMDTMALSTGHSDSKDFVKLTHGKFYRVNGATTQWQGVVPDIILPDLYVSDRFREKGDAAALKPDMGRKANFTPLPALPIAALAASSHTRISSDSAFDVVRRYGAMFTRMDKGVALPLQWPGFAAWLSENKKLYTAWQRVEKKTGPMLTAGNTSFDNERINMQSEVRRAVNKKHLANVASDIFVHEALLIMQDWLQQKN